MHGNLPDETSNLDRMPWVAGDVGEKVGVVIGIRSAQCCNVAPVRATRELGARAITHYRRPAH
jgi:hypothetical protein